MKYEYVRLLDGANYNQIIRTEGRIQHAYFKGKGWIRSGYLIKYQDPFGDYRDMVEDISEEDALLIIDKLENMTVSEYLNHLKRHFQNRFEPDAYYLKAEQERFDEITSEKIVDFQAKLFRISDHMTIPKGIERIKDFNNDSKDKAKREK